MDPAIELIRHAISRGDYTRASDLWNRFVWDLEQRIRSGRLTPSAWTDVAALFAWSRNVLLCSRARSLDLLNAVHVANAYRLVP
jgi:hypothetical protein